MKKRQLVNWATLHLYTGEMEGDWEDSGGIDCVHASHRMTGMTFYARNNSA
jgi:hypothetical protein